MRTLISAVVLLLAFASTASAQRYWAPYCCPVHPAMAGSPDVHVYESWPVEAYYAPIGPQPWYGSITVAEQARMFQARREAELQRRERENAAANR